MTGTLDASTDEEMYVTMGTSTDLYGDDWDSGY